jgi:hypothetical protein
MGITGFNLARRKQEEAAQAASLSCPAPAPATPEVADEKPKRKRRATKAPTEVGHPTWSEVKSDFTANLKAESSDGGEE